MNTDVERLIEEEETEETPETPEIQGESGICDYIYLYKMPHLTRTQLNGLDKYKVRRHHCDSLFTGQPITKTNIATFAKYPSIYPYIFSIQR